MLGWHSKSALPFSSEFSCSSVHYCLVILRKHAAGNPCEGQLGYRTLSRGGSAYLSKRPSDRQAAPRRLSSERRTRSSQSSSRKLSAHPPQQLPGDARCTTTRDKKTMGPSTAIPSIRNCKCLLMKTPFRKPFIYRVALVSATDVVPIRL
jgi:hypothetical protein